MSILKKKYEFEEKAWRHNMKPIEPKKPKKNNRYKLRIIRLSSN